MLLACGKSWEFFISVYVPALQIWGSGGQGFYTGSGSLGWGQSLESSSEMPLTCATTPLRQHVVKEEVTIQVCVVWSVFSLVSTDYFKSIQILSFVRFLRKKLERIKTHFTPLPYLLHFFTQKHSFLSVKRNLGLTSAVTAPLGALVGTIVSSMFTLRCPMSQIRHSGCVGMATVSWPPLTNPLILPCRLPSMSVCPEWG